MGNKTSSQWYLFGVGTPKQVAGRTATMNSTLMSMLLERLVAPPK